MEQLKAPFPWTGGKSSIADAVWQALGDVEHYIEPFGGSMAVLLARPHPPRIETANDLDHYLVNFWRAVQARPDEVAKHANNPIAEADLYARNKALIETSNAFRTQILDDPEFFDPKLAGWWVWGQSTIIGRPFANDLCKKMPGVHPGGVNAMTANVGVWMEELALRLRGVRILCGDWERCLGRGALGMGRSQRIRSVGVFLDPPYVKGDYKYAQSNPHEVWDDVKAWAITHGDHPHIRIVLAGYEDEDAQDMPEGWVKFTWRGHGGLGRRDIANTNRGQEAYWVSPHCLRETTWSELVDELTEGVAPP